jgi:hypothetical protein
MIRAILNARPLGGHDAIDLTILDGVIESIAPAGTVDAGGFGPGEAVDLEGRWLLPGLWDEHVHFTQWAQHLTRLDLSAAETAAEAVSIVRSAIVHGAFEDESVVVGGGFRDGLWPDEPTAELLDTVVPDRPVVLISGDVHCAWLNTLALERFGFDSPDGILREEEAFAVTAMIDASTTEDLDLWAARAAADAAARGVVGIVDLEMRWNYADWRRRLDEGFDTLRVEFGIYPEDLDRAIEAGLRTGDSIGGTVSVGSLKVISDGSLNTRTAYCCDPYPEEAPNPYGRLLVPPCDLQPLLTKARDAGLTATVHAIGDGANRLALDAFAALGGGGRIEHAQLVHEEDFPRFPLLGVTASVQPEHLLDDRDVAAHYWPGRTGRAFAVRTLLDSGAHVVFGSDAPVANLDPWRAIAAATTRTRDHREPFHPEQCISVVEAIGCSTRSRLEVGEPADLIAVEFDPLETDSATLRTMPVALTLLGGRVTFSVLEAVRTPIELIEL